MKISEKLGLNKSQLELDFYDYEIGKDTYKFLDPYYIAKKEDAFLAECNEYVETFFNRFLYFLKYNERVAYELFSHLGEVNEICLGMSKGKPAGRGIGQVNAQSIFAAIKRSDAFQNGVAEGIEDVRVFVEGVDKDKISDMVANIIKYPLMKYTEAQCDLFDIPMRNVESGYYWNKTTAQWERGHHKMLVLDGRKYLLFPKNLISDSKYYCKDEYLRMYVLTYLQQENIDNDTHLVRKTYNKNGSLRTARVFKKDIIKDKENHGEFLTKNWLARFTKDNPAIFEKFREDTIKKISDGETEEITTEEIDDIISRLITELKNIPTGSENATNYHHLMSGMLELLFYPYLNNPRLEHKIHDGRKRIDIAFNNVAEKGFLFVLAQNYGVPCPLIMFECKNYTKDITNPELDQMAGRFSPNRGQFGIICCRVLENKDLFIKKEQDTVRDRRGWIIHITDEEIIELLEARKQTNPIDEFLLKKFDEINNC